LGTATYVWIVEHYKSGHEIKELWTTAPGKCWKSKLKTGSDDFLQNPSQVITPNNVVLTHG